MAVSLDLDIKPHVPEEEIRRKLQEAPLEHADAVLAFYELLQSAHDRGILDLLRGLVGHGDTMIVKLSQVAADPETMKLVRNLLALGRIAASFDPDVLSALADELEKQKHPMRPADSVGLFSSLRRLASKDTLRVVAASAAFVGAFGRALAKAQQK